MAAIQPTGKQFAPYRKVQARADGDLRRILELTARAIQRRIAALPTGIGGVVRKAQLEATLAAVRRMQRDMWVKGITPLVVAGWNDAEDAAEIAIETMTRVAYTALPRRVADALVAGLRASAESGLKSDAVRRRRELSSRVYKLRALDEGRVEDAIRQGIISGLSARELAADVYRFVSPSTPGGSSYAAMRLARTEINNAFHERQILGAKRPGVSAVQWNLSGSHKVPDECNVYALHKPYAPDAVPDKPHPLCFCYLTYVTEDPFKFRERLAAGDFDAEIDRRMRLNLERLNRG